MDLGDDDLQLHCIIEGESEVFSVNVQGSLWHNPKFNANLLKEKIQEKRKGDSLAGVGAHSLVLWKVRAIEESPRQIMLTRHRSSPKIPIPSM